MRQKGELGLIAGESSDAIEKLKRLASADQIELFHLGYGPWDENADKKWRV